MYISKKTLGLIIVTALLASVITWTFAQEGDSDLIYSCVNNNSGTIKIVNPDEDCANNEIPLNWNANNTAGRSGISDLEVIWTTVPGADVAEVYCPSGKIAVSGGAWLKDGGPGWLAQSAPLGPTMPYPPTASGSSHTMPTGWRAKGANGASYTTAYAICASFSP